MDGAVATCELNDVRDRREGGVRYEIATPTDDAAIRALLRHTPMPGRISFSMEREPSHFAAGAIEGNDHRTIITIDGDRVIAMGSVSSRLRYINGQSMRIGYLSGLRVDEFYR